MYRDVYYSNVKLFGSQNCTDRLLKNLAISIQVAPKSLQILPSSKGLVYGSLSWILENGIRVNCKGGNPILIPQNLKPLGMKSEATRVLVIEKETVFHLLIERKIPEILNCIIITGKGYPDMGTRSLVHVLAFEIGLPIFVLYAKKIIYIYCKRTDADPHGLDIFLVYARGSSVSRLFCVPQAQWIGIKLDDISEQGLIEMTKFDLRVVKRLEKDEFIFQYTEVIDQLKKMKEYGFKAEIESLSCYNDPSFLLDLSKRILRKPFWWKKNVE